MCVCGKRNKSAAGQDEKVIKLNDSTGKACVCAEGRFVKSLPEHEKSRLNVPRKCDQSLCEGGVFIKSRCEKRLHLDTIWPGVGARRHAQ